METTPKKLHLKGERPKTVKLLNRGGLEYCEVEIPAHWLIFNAPRPLYASFIDGDKATSWQGEFKHGIFYAACDPGDTGAIQRNIELDGWVLEWHSEAEINAWVKDFTARRYPNHKIDFDDFDQRDFDHTFFINYEKEMSEA